MLNDSATATCYNYWITVMQRKKVENLAEINKMESVEKRFT